MGQRFHVRRLVVTVVLSGLTAAVAAGCGGSSGTPKTLALIKKQGYISVGINVGAGLPYATLNSNGQYAGLDADIARYMAKQLGVKVHFVSVTSETRITDVENGTTQLAAAAMAITAARAEVIDFSIPYYRGFTEFLVKAGSHIHSAADLKGKTVCVVQGTPYGAEVQKAVPGVHVSTLQTDPDCAEALKGGEVQAIMEGTDILVGLKKAVAGSVVVGVPYEFPPFDVALGLPQNDSAYRDFVNESLIKMAASGLFARDYKLWFGSAPDPTLIPTWEL